MPAGRVIVRTLAEAERLAAEAPAVISLVDDPSFAPACSCPQLVCSPQGGGSDARAIGSWADEIVAFARTVGPKTDLLVHCHEGQSRSPAAALLVLLAWGWSIPDGLERLDWAVRGRRVSPHPDLVARGDEVLGFDGALVEAVEGWTATRWAGDLSED